MTASAFARRLLPTLIAALLVAGCTTTATGPSPEGSRYASPAPSAAVVLPIPSIAPAASQTLPATGPSAEPSATPAPTLHATPVPSASPAFDPPIVRHGRFEMDLYGRRDFVTEATKWYCVPAAMLTMINIMSRGADHAKATQDRLYRLARRLSTKTLVGKGAEPIGWARGLEQLGFGAFEVGVSDSRAAAVYVAAKAIRMTGRPAGLLVWRGAHSWVMSGFRATADPAVTDRFTVTDVYIEDVWYPYVSSIWGASRPPDSLVPVAALKEDYLKWRRPTRRYPGMDGRFVSILPVARARQP